MQKWVCMCGNLWIVSNEFWKYFPKEVEDIIFYDFYKLNNEFDYDNDKIFYDYTDSEWENDIIIDRHSEEESFNKENQFNVEGSCTDEENCSGEESSSEEENCSEDESIAGTFSSN